MYHASKRHTLRVYTHGVRPNTHNHASTRMCTYTHAARAKRTHYTPTLRHMPIYTPTMSHAFAPRVTHCLQLTCNKIAVIVTSCACSLAFTHFGCPYGVALRHVAIDHRYLLSKSLSDHQKHTYVLWHNSNIPPIVLRQRTRGSPSPLDR